MQYINGLIGCTFIVIALMHAPYPTPFAWAAYLGAAGLAFITLKNEWEIWNRLPLLITCILLLSAEWFIRKRKGML